MDPLEQIFGPQGTFANRLPHYEFRPQQLEMARAVLRAIQDERHVVIEAGTGVGKSFGYLVPAILAAVDETLPRRVIVSTHTINLQDQLVRKDLPFLQRTLPFEFSAVLVKGRGNYVSLRRLQLAYESRDLLFGEPDARRQIEEIERWVHQDEEGSLSTLSFTPLATVWEEVKSEADNCLGAKCPFYERCFYFRARRRAQHAQLVIANHSLYFTDLQLRRVGASLLPDHHVVIFDEAHMLEQTAAKHFGMELTSRQFTYNLRRLFHPTRRTGLLVAFANRARLSARAGRDVQKLVEETTADVDQFFEQLRSWLQTNAATNGRVKRPPARFIECPLLGQMQRLKHAIEKLLGAGRPKSGETACGPDGAGTPDQKGADDHRLDALAQEVRAVSSRLVSLSDLLQAWLEQSADDQVYWVEQTGRRQPRLTLRSAPVRVGELLRGELFDSVETCVLASATLAVGRGDFRFFMAQVGLEDHPRCGTLQLGSPFRYEDQATVHIVEDMPEPNDHPAYEAAVAEAIRHYVRRSNERALVLFTSYQTMHEVARRVERWLTEQGIELLMQGEAMPRHRLLESFRQAKRAVLFGTDSFWQGIDLPGSALENVIITRLPFRVPDDPWLEARLEALRQEGRNPFFEYQVPQAILKFRQGFGRLIRSGTDRGMVVILDRRILTKPYGRLFLNSLPKCPVVVERMAQLRGLR